MDVSVIIVNYNTAGLVIDAVASVLEQTHGVSYEVIIVDNASPDGSGETLKQRYEGCEAVKVILSDANLGFGGANNLGFSHSEGRHILFLNPDTVLLNNAVALMVEYLENEPQVGVCGGNLFSQDGSPASSFRRVFPSVSYELSTMFGHLPEKLLYGRNTVFNHTDRPVDVAFITGADLMIRRSVADIVGLFDTKFFMYYEETDLCLRVSQAGYAVRSLPEARICHLEGKSLSNLERKAAINFQSRRLFLEKHHPKAYVCICNFIFRISVSLKILYLTFSGGEKAYWQTMRKMLNE